VISSVNSPVNPYTFGYPVVTASNNSAESNAGTGPGGPPVGVEKSSNPGEQRPDTEQQQAQRQNTDTAELQQLAARDRAVRAHEAAHKAVGGNLAGAIHFDYQTGPDGKRYAVGGEVPIDTAKVAGDPQATLLKANRIRSAALAPADPSAQDRAVAAHAAQMATEARVDIVAQQSASQNKPEQGEPDPRESSHADNNSTSTDTGKFSAPQSIAPEPSPAAVNHAVNRLLENSGEFHHKQIDPQLSLFV
jgi:hypothetical protein